MAAAAPRALPFRAAEIAAWLESSCRPRSVYLWNGAGKTTTVGASAVIAVAWCAAIATAGYLWARAVFERDPAP
jgi:hypothetical protein